MNQCVLKPYERSGGNVKVELDLSSYTEKANLKRVTGVDTSNLASKSDLASLKVEVDKLITVPADFSKLSNVVDNDVFKILNMINWSHKLIIMMLQILLS